MLCCIARTTLHSGRSMCKAAHTSAHLQALLASPLLVQALADLFWAPLQNTTVSRQADSEQTAARGLADPIWISSSSGVPALSSMLREGATEGLAQHAYSSSMQHSSQGSSVLGTAADEPKNSSASYLKQQSADRLATHQLSVAANAKSSVNNSRASEAGQDSAVTKTVRIKQPDMLGKGGRVWLQAKLGHCISEPFMLPTFLPAMRVHKSRTQHWRRYIEGILRQC